MKINLGFGNGTRSLNTYYNDVDLMKEYFMLQLDLSIQIQRLVCVYYCMYNLDAFIYFHLFMKCN